MRHGSFKKVALETGKEVALAVLPGHCKGICWTEAGLIYSPASNDGLWRISADGGEPVRITTPAVAEGELSHRFPSALPSGRSILFTIKTSGITTFDDARVAALELSTGRWKTVVQNGSRACYVATGHLVWAHDGRLLAAPFDAERLEVTGDARVVLDDLRTEPTSGVAQFAFAANGTLGFAPGGANRSNRFSSTWTPSPPGSRRSGFATRVVSSPAPGSS